MSARACRPLLVLFLVACGGDGTGPENGPANDPPVAEFTFAPGSPHAGVAVGFSGSVSSDPDGTIVGYAWDFGDGDTAAGVLVSHAFATMGAHQVTLEVTDDDGATATTTRTVSVQPPNAPPIASFSFSPTSPERGELVAFDASASGDADGTVESYGWDFGDGNTGVGAMPIHFYEDPGEFTIVLTVNDDDDDLGTTTQAVTVAPPSELSFAAIEGAWEGVAFDVQSFRVEASLSASALRGDLIGTVVYGPTGSDEVECEGEWRAAGVDGDTYTVREQIVVGAGTCPDGVVRLTYDPGTDEIAYDFDPFSGPFAAQGTLTRR
ncbi:MAG TPA: PKD domain-containing protein [Longimicrobiales bacterium]|nr:PKD domain-containing protein [Longimicrobiales bacterium]